MPLIGSDQPLTGIPTGGSAGQLLTSTGTTTPAWQYPAPAATSAVFVSGQWLDTLAPYVAPFGLTQAAHTGAACFFTPVYFPAAVTIIGLSTTTASSTTSSTNINMRVYGQSASTGGPGAFLGGGSVTSAAAGPATNQISVNIPVSAGWNYLASSQTGSSTHFHYVATPPYMYLLGESSIPSSGTPQRICWIDNTSSTPASGANATMSASGTPPVMSYRVA